MSSDENHYSDNSENEQEHSKLLSAISELDNTRRVRAPTRKELSRVVSEYHLPKGTSQTGDLVTVKELINVLKNKPAHLRIGDKVKKVIKESKTLPKPLEKPVAERIKRNIGYVNVKGQLNKWNAIVEKNRVAEHLSFPLQGGRFKLETSKQFFSKFKAKTPLEIEMSKILYGENGEEKMEEENKANENLEFPLTFEELMEKKKELAQIRAKLSHQEAKAHRQSKIKSKKYHRILKREKVKQQFKEFEQLIKSDPSAALKKLEELDRSRAQERASLRHKNTGKWARNLAVRAKYNKDSRKVLAEQLKLSRDLTEKVRKNIDSDGNESDQENSTGAVYDDMFSTSNDNPWALKVSSEVSDFVSNCKQYWNKKKESEFNSEINSSLGNKPHVNTSEGSIDKSNGETKGDIEVDDVDVQLEQDSVVKTVSSVSGSGNKKLSKKSVDENTICKKKSRNIVTETDSDCTGNIHSALTEKVAICTGNGVKNSEKSTRNRRKKSKLTSSVQSTFGSWAVTQLNEKKKRKALLDIDDMFDELDEKLAKKSTKKLKKVTKKCAEKEKKIKKVEEDSDSGEDLSFKKNPASMRPHMDEELGETRGEEPENNPIEPNNRPSFDNIENKNIPEIDPNTFVDVKLKKLNTKLPDTVSGEDYIDEEKTQNIDIVEAFGDDDVMEEFEEMKKEEEDSMKKETPDLLPGWGSWGGTDIKPSERKVKRNMISTPKLPPKKDQNKKDMIIREKANKKVVEHMVKDIPHPFKSVGAFESNMRQPVGREWIPETAHRKFIKKPIETKMGVIIDPMDESELLRLAKDRKSLYSGKKKIFKK